jgi:hypothetical protein
MRPSPLTCPISIIGVTEVRPSRLAMRTKERKSSTSGVLKVEVDGGVGGGQDAREGSLAPAIGRWTEACFPAGSKTTEADLRELLKEAADSARDDYGPEAAIEWAKGYTFPPEYMRDDVASLEAVNGDFQSMVRQRLNDLAPGRMNTERVLR